MIVLEKFISKHFEDLKREPSVAPLLPHLTVDTLTALENSPYAYSILNGDKTIVCGGVVEYWPGRGEAWAILSANLGYNFIAVTKIAARFLDACPLNRIEAAVEVNFEPGHRWAKRLGFTLEAPLLRSYLPNGRDCSLYARVRE